MRELTDCPHCEDMNGRRCNMFEVVPNSKRPVIQPLRDYAVTALTPPDLVQYEYTEAVQCCRCDEVSTVLPDSKTVVVNRFEGLRVFEAGRNHEKRLN